SEIRNIQKTALMMWPCFGFAIAMGPRVAALQLSRALTVAQPSVFDVCEGEPVGSSCRAALPLFPAFRARRNDRQQDLGRVLGVVVDGVVGDGPAPVIVERLAGIRIRVEAREITARNVQPDPVSA